MDEVNLDSEGQSTAPRKPWSARTKLVVGGTAVSLLAVVGISVTVASTGASATSTNEWEMDNSPVQDQVRYVPVPEPTVVYVPQQRPGYVPAPVPGSGGYQPGPSGGQWTPTPNPNGW